MPQYPYSPIKIILDIPSITIDNTVIQRQIELFTMIYNQNNETLSLGWLVKHYSDNEGVIGTYLGNLITDKSRISVADNSTFVDIQANGAFITEEEKETKVWMGQYDFFNMLAETQSLIIHDAIRQYGNVINWENWI